MTALHELGHAVDGHLKVMNHTMDDPERGGWREYGAGEFAADMVLHMKFDRPQSAPSAMQVEAQADPSHSANQVADEYQAASDLPEQNEGLTRRVLYSVIYHLAMDEPIETWVTMINGTVWSRIDKGFKAHVYKHYPDAQISQRVLSHPVVRYLQTTLKTSAEGLGAGDRARLAALTSGRLFVRGANGLMSYLAAKRDVQEVSNYQYHAPPEWFAELYAHYHLGTMKDHPLRGWMEQVLSPLTPNPQAQGQSAVQAPQPQPQPQRRPSLRLNADSVAQLLEKMAKGEVELASGDESMAELEEMWNEPLEQKAAHGQTKQDQGDDPSQLRAQYKAAESEIESHEDGGQHPS
ncbi:MAG: hypothetical protein U1A78_00410 [Polyangia bacterium]